MQTTRTNLPLLAILLVLGGCRFSLDKSDMHGGFGPRWNKQVQLLVVDTESEVGLELIAGWKSNSQVGKVVVLSSDEAKKIADCPSCTTVLQPFCDELVRRGDDYFVTSHFSVQYNQSFVCDRYKFSISRNSSCASGHFEDQSTLAQASFDIIDAHRCRQVQGDQFSFVVHGEKKVSYPLAQDKVLRWARRLTSSFSFPKQGRLSATTEGQLAPDADFELREGQVLAAFRNYNYLGLARAKKGVHGLSVTPLSCCFEPQAGDVIQERGPYHLLDLTLGLSTGLSEIGGNKFLAVGMHSHLRRSSIVGGVMLGISGDLFARKTQRMSQANLEFGYDFKPVPGIEVLTAATIGVRRVIDDSTTRSEVGPTLGALVGAKWTPQNFWYIGLEMHLTRAFGLSSNMEFLARNTPVGRFTLGFEFH